jgi:hypothetical protein
MFIIPLCPFTLSNATSVPEISKAAIYYLLSVVYALNLALWRGVSKFKRSPWSTFSLYLLADRKDIAAYFQLDKTIRGEYFVYAPRQGRRLARQGSASQGAAQRVTLRGSKDAAVARGQMRLDTRSRTPLCPQRNGSIQASDRTAALSGV